ncbi:Rpn family recombination-promoting nuclease/putative transposase [Lactobacillus porci]|uniref:Rpn family recombination-promoting nuclease/putative transposase n=1 Tax=Lactobacillus porci TaxID=2012477 RepID=A0A6A8MFB6_9LACO|nr:Rpn family recombination-promoting nuclease/putative transposase [Lactobacillus porci]MST87465.1 Rpn family recombination-promoting nuclease/putative transposase [Lactobacillus porci]
MSKSEIRQCSLDRVKEYGDLYSVAFSGPPWFDPWQAADATVHVKELLEIPTAYYLEYTVDGQAVGLLLGHSQMFHSGRIFEISDLAVRPDKHMPARVMNYDAAAYRYQLTKSKTLYPVLTLVVYYGKEAWNYSRNLLGNIELQKLPKEMRQLISDYEIKAFYRISDLSALELDQRFKSAFFCLAEYFIQTNAGEEYHPSAKKLSIEDIMLLLDMMNALSGTHAYDELIRQLEEKDKNEVTTMTEVLPQFIQVKIDRAKKENTEEVTAKVTKEVTRKTTENVTKDYLLNILNTTNLTPDKAMDLLGIPAADRPMYKELLKKTGDYHD